MNKNVIEIVFCRQSAWGSAYTQRIVSRKSSSSVYLSLSECFLCCTCFKVITCVGVKPRTCFEGNLLPYVTRTRAYLFAEYVSRSGLDRLRHITYCGQSFITHHVLIAALRFEKRTREMEEELTN